MIKFKVGDKVKVIDDNTHGVITQINENEIIILSDFGFDESYVASELLPDVDLDEEIEVIDDKPTTTVKPIKKSKNTKSIKKSKSQKIFEEESEQKAELTQLINDNFAKNSDAYREKLEEQYKKEIKVSKKRKGTFVLDLHYGQLENFSAQLPIHRILKRQLNAAINGIEKARNEGFAKIILVHGKGKGVLESEVKKYLDSEGYTHYDADFRQYKLGATEVEL